MRRSVPLQWWKWAALCLPLLAGAPSAGAEEAPATGDWRPALAARLDRLDRETPGALGVYVHRLDNGETLSHGGDRAWYLGSTVKVIVAIAVLQEADAGRLRLAERMTLTAADRTEAGQIVWQPVGTGYTIEQLLRRMLGDSDNTAANMLIRRIGVDRLNAVANAAMGRTGHGEFTTFLQVRQDVYAEIHPDARRLSNDQLVRIAGAPMGPARVTAVRRALDKSVDELDARTVEEAYERYYRTGRNSATLEAYGAMLEKLVRGELLSPERTRFLFQAMKLGDYTNYRLQAGLPRSASFIHKTGTQYLRACHAGVIAPEANGAHAIVVAACTAELDEQHAAGALLERVGRAIAETVLVAR